MSQSRPRPSRVETALELVHRQRKIVDATQIGSPAHRQASDVLALIEESHFLLSELERTTVPTVTRAAFPSLASCEPHASRPARRVQLQLVLAFAAAVVVAAAVLEMADPAPMDIQASELVPTPP